MNEVNKFQPNPIGILNETTLHADLKWLLSESRDQLEKRVENYIIDIVRDDLLIEIQTSNFANIRKKLEKLLKKYKIRLVHPIIRDKWISNLDSQVSKVIRRRLSPKHSSYIDIFEELIRIPHIVSHPNFTIELLLVQIEEIREKNNQASWRRKGWSIYDKKLVKIVERKQFKNPHDFLCFIPKSLETPFTNLELARSIKKPIRLVRKMSYCLRKMGMLKVVGKRGNAYLFNL
jgi:FtsZ-binding cell division protein ZapB